MRALRFSTLLLATALIAFAACNDNSLGLPTATLNNVVDSVSLWAVDGTPINTPSAYNIIDRSPVLTYQTTEFDFAFNITPSGDAVLLPTGAVGLGKQSGILVQSKAFDAITEAPSSGYQDSVAVTMDSGTVAILHSRPVSFPRCPFVVFFYAKLQVLRVDTLARRIDYNILVDQNCGHRGLEPGIPKR